MKKIFAFLLALITVSSLIAGCTPNNTDDPQESSSYITTDETTTENIETTETLATDSSNTEQPVGTGGSIKDKVYGGKLNMKFYAISASVSDLVLEDPTGEKLAKWRSELGHPSSILKFIIDFNISKEDLIEENNRLLYHPIFTQEEIDALYSDDITKIYAAFVNENAILKGDEIYPPSALYNMSWDEMVAAGITKEDIAEKMTRWGGVLGYTTFYPKMVSLCKE